MACQGSLLRAFLFFFFLSMTNLINARHLQNINNIQNGSFSHDLLFENFLGDTKVEIPKPVVHYAYLERGRANGGNDRFYGVIVTINLYALPTVKNGQKSSIQVVFVNGGNGIFFGVTVDPATYGDTDLHFYVAYTVDLFTPGCENFKCPGYVQQNASKIVPGQSIQPISTIGGTQYELTLTLQKDKNSRDWWLYHGPQGQQEVVGYWPKSLFAGLANYASLVQVGGIVSYEKGDPSPPMGNGYRPELCDGKAAYLKDVVFIGVNDNQYPWAESDINQDRKDCYSLHVCKSFTDKVFVGGSGGCTD